MELLVLVSATLLSAGAFPSSPVIECDKLASHSADPDRAAPGLEQAEMDLVAGEAACRLAVEAAPENARSQYQLGRTIFYQGRQKEAMPYLEKAAEIGYRQSIFVLAFVHTLGGAIPRDFCKAQSLWRRSAGLDHPWSGYHLVNSQLNGDFKQCKSQVSDTEMARFMGLATDRITVASSSGRVEKLSADLDAYLAKE